jgi:hypothetical protein
MPPPPPPPPPPLEDEEEDEEFEDEEPDMFEALGSFLATEDGETVATIQLRQAEASEKIAAQLETQNKILVKILSEMKCRPVSSETIEP